MRFKVTVTVLLPRSSRRNNPQGAFALFFETFVAAFLCYMPFTEKGLRTFPLMCATARSAVSPSPSRCTLLLVARLLTAPLCCCATRARRWYWWIPAMPFSLLIWVFDEVRKFTLRRASKTDFVYRETYY